MADETNERASLVEKYADLVRRHARLLESLHPARHETSLLAVVGAWTMRGFSASVALLREGRVAIANPRWWKLQAHAGPFVFEGGSQQRFRSLIDLVLSRLPRGAGALTGSQRVRSLGLPGLMLDVHIESRSTDGQRTTLVLVFDATAQMNAERAATRVRDAAQQRQRLTAVGEVASGMAHDLESTLQGLLLRVALLERDASIGKKQQQNLAHLRFGIESAAEAVGKIRRLGSRRDEATETLDLKTLIEEAIELVGLQFTRRPGDKTIQVEKSIWPLPPVIGRKGEIFHLLVNLLLNARDAMPNGGRVRVAARTTELGARVTIADEGPGIAPEALDRVFDPFFTTKAHGTGLGLSLAHATMIELGGRISVANRPSGGAVIALDFPRVSSSSDVPRAKAKPSARSRTAPPRSPRRRRNAPKSSSD